MKCTDTDCHEAIHLPELELEVARDINDALAGVRGYGHGTGQIILNVVNGCVNFIDFTSRKHRKPGSKQAASRIA